MESFAKLSEKDFGNVRKKLFIVFALRENSCAYDNSFTIHNITLLSLQPVLRLFC